MSLLDKAKKIAEQGKGKLEDIRELKAVNDLYAEIGRLAVQQRRGNAPADADAQIEAKMAEITKLEEENAPSASAPAATPPSAPPAPPTSSVPPENVPMAPPPAPPTS
jgi:hypothetical protein